MENPAPEFETLVRYLKAVADATRLRLLGMLAGGERSVEEMAALLGVKTPTVSHHLALLREVEVVQMRAEGNVHLYRLNEGGLQRIGSFFNTPQQVAALAGDLADDTWERKVLRDFFEDGRLTGIPASRKKRDVILRWLAERFEPGRVYTEPEVNELLKRYHPDAATLRRELIGYGLLGREHGAYWRLAADAAGSHDAPEE
ncbi:MAG TPA: metalloregulator ArsR/SmtB family transcription factor [Ktedonobacterales bacterium]|jgi:hypothetical protein|nr:metalloregulator ArsR/SmtB family transcription factor [Ktedonobacterales bacterium]